MLPYQRPDISDYFSSVLVPVLLRNPPLYEADPELLDHPWAPPLHQLQLEVQDVLSAFLASDSNKATEPDRIPCRLLKETAQQIAPSLTQLHNLSLRLGVVPDEWKLAKIIPVHKKGEKQHVENYRPISLLSVLSKVLERCVLTKIRDHLLSLINKAQHGFIPGRSCTPQLLQVLHLIGSLLDSGKQTDVIYIDMSKAFDKVDDTALLYKLEHRSSISRRLLRWFKSYLSNRRQQVTVLGYTSPVSLVTSGVPQGSILWPILFPLYVNDLPDPVQNSKVACFADDTNLFKRIDTASDAALLQQDLGNLEHLSKLSGQARRKQFRVGPAQ